MKSTVLILLAVVLGPAGAVAFDLPSVPCRESNTPSGSVTWALTPESARKVRSVSCVRAGTRLTVRGRVQGRGGEYDGLDLSISGRNFRSGSVRSTVPTLNSDGTFQYTFTSPRHRGPTGDPSPQGIEVTVIDPSLGIDLPNTPLNQFCAMRKRPDRNVQFRACLQR